MTVISRRFGEIDATEDKVLLFNECLPGINGIRRYIFVRYEKTIPFYWLQSVEGPDIALPVINPYEFIDDYMPAIEDSDLKELEVEKTEDLLVLCVAVIRDDIAQTTVNLAAPVLINIKMNLGKQVILNDNRYEIRHRIFNLCNNMKGGDSYTCSDAQSK